MTEHGTDSANEPVHDLLAGIDRDGAVAETMAGAVSRSGFLRSALLATGAVAATLGLPAALLAAGDSPGDTAILNYLLTLERLQADFFTEAESVGALSGRERVAAATIAPVERAHVAALLERLGPDAIEAPTFDFRGTTEHQVTFVKTAVAFEDLAAASIAGVIPDIADPAIRATVASVYTTEARHAGWIRALADVNPAPDAIQSTLGRGGTIDLVNSTGFIASEPLTTSGLRPSFTG